MGRSLVTERAQEPLQTWRPWLVWTLLLVYFGLFGVIIGAKGVLWAEVVQRLGLSKSAFGSALLVSPLVSVGVLLGGGQLTAWFTKKQLALMSLLLLGGSCLAVAFSIGWWTLAGALVITGLAHGLLETAMNGATLDWEQATGRNAMNTMHAGFSGGAVLGALLAGVLIEQNWRYEQIFVLASLVCVLVLAATVPVRYPPQQVVAPDSVHATAALRIVFGSRILIVLAVLSLLGVVGESVANQWSVIYLRELGANAGISGAAFALFNGAMFSGRLLNGPLVDRMGAQISLLVSGIALVIGTILLLLPGGVGLAIVALVLMGLGVAGVVPTVLSVAARVSPGNSGAVAGGIMAAAYACFIVSPPLIGWIGEAFSLRLAWLLVGISGVGIIWLVRDIRAALHKTSSPEAATA